MIKIDLHDYNIIYNCKKSMDDAINYLKEYFFIEELEIGDLYAHLLQTYLKVGAINDISDLFIRKLSNVYYNKLLVNDNNGFNYNDFIKLIYRELQLLQVCKTDKKGEMEDIYEVKINDDYIPYSQVQEFLDKKKQKKLKKDHKKKK